MKLNPWWSAKQSESGGGESEAIFVGDEVDTWADFK
jgi:hypothetical protein